jgi:DNA-binding NtrC family response regulator
MSSLVSVGSAVTSESRPAVLFVDDEAPNVELFRLQFKDRFRVLIAHSGDEALGLLARNDVAVLLSDERMPGMSGVELLARVLERWPDVVRIIVSAYSDAPRLLAAMNRGHAHEYIVKPWDKGDLHGCIERALASAMRRRELALRAEQAEMLDRDLAAEHGAGAIVTQDPGMLALLAMVRKAARNDAAVLIHGETGTGKELVARLIHDAGERARGPFVRVNCAALSEGVLESELFGHEQGAFTGAHRARRGRFELAEGGTIFLDEIGDVSPKVQVSLLRVLQEKELERVGGNATVRINARVVTATHRNLAQLMREGRFREDLYYRLNVVPIEVPPLRERRGDIPALVRHFVAKHAPRSAPAPIVPEPVLAELAAYSWPGNVRELENLVQRAIVLCEGPELSSDDFRFMLSVEDEGAPPPGAGNLSPRSEARQTEREQMRRILVENGGNVARAARALGVPRTTLVSRAKKHGLLV